jgi:hypothetical protein
MQGKGEFSMEYKVILSLFSFPFGLLIFFLFFPSILESYACTSERAEGAGGRVLQDFACS